MYPVVAVEDDDRHGTVRRGGNVGKMKDLKAKLKPVSDNKQEIWYR